jgi:hypothetical protein
MCLILGFAQLELREGLDDDSQNALIYHPSKPYVTA